MSAEIPESETKHISRRDLILLVGKSYDEDGLQDGWGKYIDDSGHLILRGAIGDTLADFIILELDDTYDEAAPRSAQIVEACRVLQMAQQNIANVLDSLYAAA
jgi:hypothetical protein